MSLPSPRTQSLKSLNISLGDILSDTDINDKTTFKAGIQAKIFFQLRYLKQYKRSAEEQLSTIKIAAYITR